VARGSEGVVYPWGDRTDSNKMWSIDRVLGRPLDSFEAWSRSQQDIVVLAIVARPAQVGSYPGGSVRTAPWTWPYRNERPTGLDLGNTPSRLNGTSRGPHTGELRVLLGGARDVPRVVIQT